ncbi:hypothetical protein ACS04_02960 [Streptomyces roseus]|uniref:Tyr recombinase domain-containing protein n=1 Tax=Streptomyces roseus TaxID=66430 RepID=A0A0J6XSY4_9ACTN|nr:hypothetical protein ACS04_02960 [Streptomyces roseus]
MVEDRGPRLLGVRRARPDTWSAQPPLGLPERPLGSGDDAEDGRFPTSGQSSASTRSSRLASAIGIRWRLMMLLGAYVFMRPEGLAELRRADIVLDTGSVRVRRVAPQLSTGSRVIGDPKSPDG